MTGITAALTRQLNSSNDSSVQSTGPAPVNYDVSHDNKYPFARCAKPLYGIRVVCTARKAAVYTLWRQVLPELRHSQWYLRADTRINICK